MIPITLAAILGGGLSIIFLGWTTGLCLAPLFGSLAGLGMGALLGPEAGGMKAERLEKLSLWLEMLAEQEEGTAKVLKKIVGRGSAAL